MDTDKNKTINKSAYAFIFIMGFVSLFSDFTHEGARSIYGNYLSFLGAGAMIISTVAGFGEFIGQGLRIFTGYITDKTKRYWTFAIVGYSFNIIIIPLFALIPMKGWMLACALVILERVGKAIRAPAKSTLISFAGDKIGVGKTFAIHEALDQIGAFLGPLLLFIIMSLMNNSSAKTIYSVCFLALGITALISVIILLIAKKNFPNPDIFEKEKNNKIDLIQNNYFWIYILAIGFIAAGFTDYPLIAYHIESSSAIPIQYIPLLYSLAMGVDAIAALFFGSMFDRKGLISLIMAVCVSSFFGIFIFALNNTAAYIIIGVILWGIGMGAQESILKAVVAKIVSKEHRASAYGIFNSSFGLFWFLGSLLLGYLYELNLTVIALVSFIMQLLSIPLMAILIKKIKIE